MGSNQSLHLLYFIRFPLESVFLSSAYISAMYTVRLAQTRYSRISFNFSDYLCLSRFLPGMHTSTSNVTFKRLTFHIHFPWVFVNFRNWGRMFNVQHHVAYTKPSVTVSYSREAALIPFYAFTYQTTYPSAIKFLKEKLSPLCYDSCNRLKWYRMSFCGTDFGSCFSLVIFNVYECLTWWKWTYVLLF